METNKHIAPPGYLVALMLFLFPLVDGITSIWPPRMGEERWRFGAVGSISNLTLLPLTGIVLGIVIAVMFDHRRTRRVIGALCGVFAVLLACASVIFVLDFFQMRTQVKPQFKRMMDIASTTSLVKQTCTILALTLLARAGLGGRKAVVKGKKANVPAESTGTPLIPLGVGARPE